MSTCAPSYEFRASRAHHAGSYTYPTRTCDENSLSWTSSCVVDGEVADKENTRRRNVSLVLCPLAHLTAVPTSRFAHLHVRCGPSCSARSPVSDMGREKSISYYNASPILTGTYFDRFCTPRSNRAGTRTIRVALFGSIRKNLLSTIRQMQKT